MVPFRALREPCAHLERRATRHDGGMDLDLLRAHRLRAHQLSAPARDAVAAAEHLGATQAQEFWGGRWALAVRTAGAPTLREVDAAFERGDLVRAWTQRGTLHIVASRDLAWILSVTGDRQQRQYAASHRSLGITPDTLRGAERAIRPALAGGNRLTRAEFADVLAAAGLDTSGMRGYHLLAALCLRGVTVLGPVVPRDGAPGRDQYVVAADEWITEAATPADPLAELFVRYLRGHGPASLADFRWWTGLTLGLARAARDAAGDRVVEVEEGLFEESGTADGPPPVPTGIFALPPFEEYYISYADRSVAGAPELRAAVGPSANGQVKPILLDRGEVVGTWSHSLAVGRHHLDPVATMADGARQSEVDAALARFAAFLRG